ncbi:MAG: Fpg/Nei family DNA glycosylase [Acidimicrobiia bacterium]
MPEGDTIHRAAAVLRTALVGRVLLAVDMHRHVGPPLNVGSTIESVQAKGKHLLIEFDDDRILHTHMRMTGSWHVYRPGERWRKPTRAARVVLETDEWMAVCFNAPVVEVYRNSDRRRHPGLGSLGPDLCVEGVDVEACVQRMNELTSPTDEIGVVLQDQRIACGVGNVYRNEVLWLAQVSPYAPMRTIGLDVRTELLENSARLLQLNLATTRRVTVPEVPGGVAVYGRAGKPCFTCRTPIEIGHQGELNRLTYWCPVCQPVPLAPEEIEAEAAEEEHPASDIGFDGAGDGWQDLDADEVAERADESPAESERPARRFVGRRAPRRR